MWLFGIATLNKKAVLPQGNRAIPQLFFNEVHYKYKSQASKDRLHSSKVTCWRKTEFSDSKSFKVTRLESLTNTIS